MYVCTLVRSNAGRTWYSSTYTSIQYARYILRFVLEGVRFFFMGISNNGQVEGGERRGGGAERTRQTQKLSYVYARTRHNTVLVYITCCFFFRGDFEQ